MSFNLQKHLLNANSFGNRSFQSIKLNLKLGSIIIRHHSIYNIKGSNKKQSIIQEQSVTEQTDMDYEEVPN